MGGSAAGGRRAGAGGRRRAPVALVGFLPSFLSSWEGRGSLGSRKCEWRRGDTHETGERGRRGTNEDGQWRLAAKSAGGGGDPNILVAAAARQEAAGPTPRGGALLRRVTSARANCRFPHGPSPWAG
jgi:hypothetical protein